MALYFWNRIFILLILSGSLLANNFADLKIISQNGTETIYEYTLLEPQFSPDTVSTEIMHNITFYNASNPAGLSKYNLPIRIFTIGVPKSANTSLRVISKTTEIKAPFNINPVISVNESSSQTALVKLRSARHKLRDIYIQNIEIAPLSYHAQSKKLTIYNKIRFAVNIKNNANQQTQFTQNGTLSSIYKERLINFEQAQGWQVAPTKSLSKKTNLGIDKYWGFTITEDGLYKVTAADLKSEGVDITAVSVGALQLYNNGGHTLTVSTNAPLYNPAFTQEVAIKVMDLNNNNLFDGSDYFIFWGKGLNSWFYEEPNGVFKAQNHPYDTKNIYWLKVNGQSGKRMALQPQQANPSFTQQDFAFKKYHFEEDKYNILNSGTDWYGHKFIGLSGAISYVLDIDPINTSEKNAEFTIKFKGGSGYEYYNKETYFYDFSVSLNGNTILSNKRVSYANSGTYTLSLPMNYFNTSAENKLNISYVGNNSGAVAYLDYFSLSYPTGLSSQNNFAQFYHQPDGANYNYQLSGYTNSADKYIFDVTDPVNPIIKSENVADQTVSVIAANSLTATHFVAASLTSSEIKTVKPDKSYTPVSNLLSSGNQADFIIITRNALRSFGAQIAELRPEYKTSIVSVEDIEFFFNSAVQDPTSIRNFIRYAYNNWTGPELAHVLLLGDGHYDYRNIIVKDSMLVPTYQISANNDVVTREVDQYFTDLERHNHTNFDYIVPSISIGRIPVENTLDAERFIEKLKIYQQNPAKDAWQTFITFVADDQLTGTPGVTEWSHQSQAESLAKKAEIQKFNINKIYLSAYPSVPGGRRRIKPEATQKLIDQINRGSLIINYTGHGSPTEWADESVFNFERDYNKIINENKFPFFVAATCDFGLFDNPAHFSFSEALIWKEKSGSIGTVAATRLVYGTPNFSFTDRFYAHLFPSGAASVTIGEAFINSTNGSINDQKFHILSDPTLKLADPRLGIKITSISPDTLKALSQVTVKGEVQLNKQIVANFNGGAILFAHDALYQDVNTGGGANLNYTLPGPLIFKGEVSVVNGQFEGTFIIPKSIRQKDTPLAKISVYAWDEAENIAAYGLVDTVRFYGISQTKEETVGPDIDLYFENQENFNSGDFVSQYPILKADISDESGINITGILGHKIGISVDGAAAVNISESFKYNKDSFKAGTISYPLTELKAGKHTLVLHAYDNLNNRSETEIEFSISDSKNIKLEQVVNYPNPFEQDTKFTFQTNIANAETTIKIYTIYGRLIKKIEGHLSNAGFNEVYWNGRDADGDTLANGTYLYKVILKNGNESKEKIEKLTILK